MHYLVMSYTVPQGNKNVDDSEKDIEDGNRTLHVMVMCVNYYTTTPRLLFLAYPLL